MTKADYKWPGCKYINGHVQFTHQNVFQQQNVDHKITFALLKKGTRDVYKTWHHQDSSWVNVHLHESHEGGFGVTNNVITNHAVSLRPTSGLLPSSAPLSPLLNRSVFQATISRIQLHGTPPLAAGLPTAIPPDPAPSPAARALLPTSAPNVVRPDLSDSGQFSSLSAMAALSVQVDPRLRCYQPLWCPPTVHHACTVAMSLLCSPSCIDAMEVNTASQPVPGRWVDTIKPFSGRSLESPSCLLSSEHSHVEHCVKLPGSKFPLLSSWSTLMTVATKCDETEPQWPLRTLNHVLSTTNAWNSFQNWLYYENKLVLSSVFLSFNTSEPHISRSYLQISVWQSSVPHISRSYLQISVWQSLSRHKQLTGNEFKIHLYTLKTFFIRLYKNFIPCENCFCSMLCISFHTKDKHFVPWAWYFIPSGQVFIPHATNFTLISFSTHLIASLIVCIHSFTTERTSNVCGCSLWPNYVAQSSSSPTGWLWPAPTAPTWHASNSGAHTSSCVCTTNERRSHSLRPAELMYSHTFTVRISNHAEVILFFLGSHPGSLGERTGNLLFIFLNCLSMWRARHSQLLSATRTGTVLAASYIYNWHLARRLLSV